MHRLFATALALALGAIAFVASAAAQGYTTRIEPRPFYGAVVTLEEGVRVIRPLPPERQVIINPNNTPLSLGFNETNVYERRNVYHKYEGPVGAQRYRSGGGLPYGLPYGYGYGSYGYGKHGKGHKGGGFSGYASGAKFGYGSAKR